MFRINRLGLLLLFSLGVALRSHAQLITGVADRTVYVDTASFSVATNVGFTYQVTLNGTPVAAGISHVVTRIDYYDLLARRTQISDGSVVSQLIRFIVMASDRGDGSDHPERGLIRWTPFPPIPSASAEFAGGQLSVVAPSNFPAGLEIPVIAWVDDGPGNARRVNGDVLSSFPGSPLPLRRGVGHAFLPGATNANPVTYDAHIHSLASNKVINIDSSTTWSNVSGFLPAATIWPPNSRIRVTSHITISSGNTLTIGAGTIVLLNAGVNITNSGRTVINGTTTQPVVFTAATRVAPESQSGAWGGFLLRSASAELIANGAIMTGSGAASGFSFTPGTSHKGQQALLLIHSGARAMLTNCFLINNAGQIGNGFNSDVTFDHCVLQRAVTAGEYEGGTVIVNNSAIIEFPSIDGVYNAAIAEGDYDGIYFTTGTHILQDSLFGFAKDDAIDSGSGGSGTVVVSNCWVESALHEALAWSGGDSGVTSGRKTWTYDSVLINNGQGLECGWSTGPLSPLVVGGRVLSLANSVGVRYGDNYTGTSGLGLKDGFLTVTNCIVLHNYRDVWGQVWDDTWNYRVNDMDIHDNFLTAPNTNHPNNSVWNPATDAARLAPFMHVPLGAAVGVGFANWDPLTIPALTNGVPVRLSIFTTNVVSVDYAVEKPDTTVASGTLTFQPGETVKYIYSPITGLSTQDLVRVALSNPVACEITTASQLLIVPANSNETPPVTLIPFLSTWKYFDDGLNLGTAWRGLGYNDTGWSNGLAQLGYGETDENTKIRKTNSAMTFTITFYFRKTIQVADPTDFDSLRLRLWRDDAGVVYVNSNEVFRSSNLSPPPAVIGYLTPANATGENSVDTEFISATNLVAGPNIIAVEIHQESTTSSDVSFDFELVGIFPPRLNAALFGDDLVLYWSNAAYKLEATDELGPAANWQFFPGASPVSVAPTGPQRFFRLRK